MQLKHFLDKHKISGRQLGKKLNLKSSSSISNYLNGKRIPSTEVMLKIFEFTKGEVTPYDFLRLPKNNYKDFFIESKAKLNFLTYQEKLALVNSFYKKYRKSVKQKNIADIISNKGETLSVMSVSDRLNGKINFTDFELEKLFNFYFTKEFYENT